MHEYAPRPPTSSSSAYAKAIFAYSHLSRMHSLTSRHAQPEHILLVYGGAGWGGQRKGGGAKEMAHIMPDSAKAYIHRYLYIEILICSI